jgi:hypothetical protein
MTVQHDPAAGHEAERVGRVRHVHPRLRPQVLLPLGKMSFRRA